MNIEFKFVFSPSRLGFDELKTKLNQVFDSLYDIDVVLKNAISRLPTKHFYTTVNKKIIEKKRINTKHYHKQI